jgi:hypothetical protein
MIIGRTPGFGFRRCFTVFPSHRFCAWEGFGALDGQELSSEYSKLPKFLKFPAL